MTRIAFSGAETNETSFFETLVSASIASGVSGMSGTYCYDLTGAFARIYKDVAAKDEYYAAFKFKHTGQTYNCVITFWNGTANLGSLRWNNNNTRFEAYRASSWIANGTATPTGVVLVEVHYKPHTSSGVFQVKVNGTLDIDFSGQTANSTLQVNKISFGRDPWDVGDGGFYVDDIILDDTNWIGDTRAQLIRASGAGDATQLTPSAGSNWDCVDELGNSATDYVSGTSADLLDLYALNNPVSIDTAKAVCVTAHIRATSGLKVQLAIKTHGTVYYSPSKDSPVPTGIGPVSHIWETNPYTAESWTNEELNDLQTGARIVSS